MKATGLAVLAMMAQGAKGLTPLQTDSSQVNLPPVIDTNADQRLQVLEGLSPAGRELLGNDLWVGARIFTQDGDITYFMPKDRTGPQPGCRINYGGASVIGYGLNDRHKFWANCSTRNGSVELDFVDLYTMPNGDAYVERQHGAREMPCDIGNFSDPPRRYVTQSEMVQTHEICTPAPTAPTAPTGAPSTAPSRVPTAPTGAPSTAPSRAPTAAPTQTGSGLSPEAIAAIAAGVGGAVVGGGCLLKGYLDGQQGGGAGAGAVALDDIAAPLQAVDPDLPLGAAPAEAYVAPQVLGAPPVYQHPPPAYEAQDPADVAIHIPPDAAGWGEPPPYVDEPPEGVNEPPSCGGPIPG